MRGVRRDASKGQPPQVDATLDQARQLAIPLDDGTIQLALVQALIPLGLKAVEEMLRNEVTTLAGVRYAREAGPSRMVRWGRQAGSIFLADQKVPITLGRIGASGLGPYASAGVGILGGRHGKTQLPTTVVATITGVGLSLNSRWSVSFERWRVPRQPRRDFQLLNLGLHRKWF